MDSKVALGAFRYNHIGRYFLSTESVTDPQNDTQKT